MGKRPFLFIIAFCVLWLAACEQAVPTATATEPPTATLSPTIVSVETAVVKPFAEFKLKIPDAKTLIQLRMNPYKMPTIFANDLNLTPITLPEPIATDHVQQMHQQLIINNYVSLLENDFQHYYPKEIFSASVFLFPHHEYSSSSSYLFGRGVIDYLNTYGHSLDVTKKQAFRIVFDPYWYKGKIMLKSLPMQLDNDSEMELLLLTYHTDTTVSYRFSGSAYIPVNITSQNKLEIIPNDFTYEAAFCHEIDISHDLNHDKQNDLLFFCQTPVAYAVTSKQVVFGWSEEGVYHIGETDTMSWQGGKQKPYKVDVGDVDSDGFEEIIWQIPCNGHTKGNCEIVNTFSWPGQQDLHQEESSPFVDSEACKEMMAAFAQNYKTEQCLRQLREIVITQTDPDIPNKITDLLNYLPSDDPEARPYREHLTYLLGYHYELSGVEEEAVATYLDLIQQNPSSPWSWLAWARLEPVE
jgi:hypothetical protein